MCFFGPSILTCQLSWPSWRWHPLTASRDVPAADALPRCASGYDTQEQRSCAWALLALPEYRDMPYRVFAHPSHLDQPHPSCALRALSPGSRAGQRLARQHQHCCGQDKLPPTSWLPAQHSNHRAADMEQESRGYGRWARRCATARHMTSVSRAFKAQAQDHRVLRNLSQQQHTLLLAGAAPWAVGCGRWAATTGQQGPAS